MPQIFSPDAFEALLFPMNSKVYDALEAAFVGLEQEQPGFLTSLDLLYKNANALAPGQGIDVSVLEGMKPPQTDIQVDLACADLKRLRKCTEVQVRTFPHRLYRSDTYPGCHLVLRVTGGPYPQTFIVPLAYLLRRFRAITCSPGMFQVYQHRIFPTAQVPVIPGVMVLPQPALLKDLTRIGLIYTGITRRDWRTRLKEHLAAARKSSALLFHQALRGDLIAIASVEHEILRVGLTTDQAMDIEEAEVERRSLFPLHRNGLNMVPGGRAGFAFLANMRGPGGRKVQPGETEEVFAEIVAAMFAKAGGVGNGSAISALWRNDLNYRVRVMTGAPNRLSELQIASARIWHASDWLLEKIVANLKGIDGRGANALQVRRLLEGKTYGSIPNRPLPPPQNEARP